VVGSRFFVLAPVGDTLFVRNGEQSHSFAWTVADGWQPTAVDVLPEGVLGGPGAEWAGGMVIPSYLPGGIFDLYFFDSTTTTLIASELRAWAIGDDDHLYVTQGDAITRTPAPATALSAATASLSGAGGFRSLCILPGSTQALIGTADSYVLRIDLT
jgi:hypothetical protein